MVAGMFAAAGAVPSLAATERSQYEHSETGLIADQQSFTVPAEITEIAIRAIGAGATGVSGYPGGSGAVVTSRHTVMPGEVLHVRVGGGGRGTQAGGSYAGPPPAGAEAPLPQFSTAPILFDLTPYGAGVDGLIANDGHAEISWNPPSPPPSDPPVDSGPGLAAQLPTTACVVAPTKLAKRGKKTVLRNPCVTTAGQAVTIRVTGKKGPRAKPRYRVVRAAGGGKAIRTFGRKVSLTVTWSAPATSTAAAYLKTQAYRR